MDFVSFVTNAGVMVDMAGNRSEDKCECVLDAVQTLIFGRADIDRAEGARRLSCELV
jgi:hypothetical protein